MSKIDILQKGADIVAPTAKAGAGMIVLAVTATAARFAIPATLRGKFANFTMDGSDADVLFGDATVAAGYGAASAVDGTTRVITPAATGGAHLKDAVTRTWRIPTRPEVTHFSVICKAAGAGNLYLESA